MKARHLLMSVGLVGAAWLAFFGDKPDGAGMAEPVVRRSGIPSPISTATASTASAPTTMLPAAGEAAIGGTARAGAEPQASRGKTAPEILALLPRAELLGAIGQANTGLFSSKSWTPPVKAVQAPLPSAPQGAPPLPFTYLGKQTAGGQIEVFLANGDTVYIAREKDVIQNTWRVEAIVPPTMSLVYLPLNEIQRLSIGVTN